MLHVGGFKFAATTSASAPRNVHAATRLPIRRCSVRATDVSCNQTAPLGRGFSCVPSMIDSLEFDGFEVEVRLLSSLMVAKD